VWWPAVDMRFAARDIDALIDAIHGVLAEHAGERGLVHATYAVAEALRARGHALSPRLSVQRRGYKAEAIAEFLDIRPNDDRVLVLSGQYEGLDLHGDLARFQIVTQVPRPSIEDPGMLWLAENDPRRYQWLAVRDLAQAYGRTTRSPDDFSTTIVLDASAGPELASPDLPESTRDALVVLRPDGSVIHPLGTYHARRSA
jgi:Rad3-related DNA helicase